MNAFRKYAALEELRQIRIVKQAVSKKKMLLMALLGGAAVPPVWASADPEGFQDALIQGAVKWEDYKAGNDKTSILYDMDKKRRAGEDLSGEDIGRLINMAVEEETSGIRGFFDGLSKGKNR